MATYTLITTMEAANESGPTRRRCNPLQAAHFRAKGANPSALSGILGVTELVNRTLISSVNDRTLLTEAIVLIRAALGQPQQTTMANLKTNP